MIANLLCPRALRYIFGLTLLATAARAQTPVITTASDFGTIPVGVADLNFSATGGNGTYSWGLTGGSLPPNTVLRTDLNTTSSTISAVVSGVVEVPGTYTFTLQVT